MKKLIKIYNSTGRIGIILLISVLIISALAGRMYAGIKHFDTGYIIETVLFIIVLILMMRFFKKSNKETIKKSLFKSLLIAGLILRLIFAVHDMINRPVQESDYIKHEKLGARIAFEGEFYDFAGVELRNFRQPGLPFLFAAGLLIYNSPVVYPLIMILLSFGVLIAGYYLFRSFVNHGSVISFGYIAIAPNMLFMASNSNTQLLFFLLIILLFIVLKNFTGKFYQLVIIGALLAAEMYVRFNFLLIFLLIPFMIEQYYSYPEKRRISAAFSKAGIVIIFFLIFYSPWVIRNYNVYGKIRLMPSEGPRFYSSNVIKDFTKAGGYNGIPDSVINKYKHLPEEEFDKALREDAVKFVLSNPETYIKGIPFRVMKYSGRQDWTIGYFFEHTGYSNSELLNEIFQGIENIFFMIILIYPLFFFLKNKNLSALSSYIIWTYLIYSLLLLTVSESRSRYNFPYILFPVFAAAFVNRSHKDIKEDEIPVSVEYNSENRDVSSK